MRRAGAGGLQPSQRYALLDERRAAADDMHDLTRAVLLLEQSRSPQELADAARQAAALLLRSGEQGREELRRAFSVWLHVLGRRLPSAGEAPPEDDDLVETLEEVAMSLADRVATWGEPYLRQGIERGLEQGLVQGIEQGVRQGLDGQRALLRRQAAARFGDATAERLFARLRQEESPEWLAEVGEAIVRCETGEDLLRSAGA